MLDSNVNDIDNAAAVPNTSASSNGVIVSPNVIRGFSASQISSSYWLNPPITKDNPLTDDIPNVRCTFQPEFLTTRKKCQTFNLRASCGNDQSSLDDRMASVAEARSRRYLSEGLTQPRSPSRTDYLDIEVEPRAIKPSKEGTDKNIDANESDEEDLSENLTINDDGSSGWEDTVPESGLSRVNEKYLFPWANLWPDIVSRPSILTEMMYEASPLNTHPTRTTRAGQSKSSPEIQRLHDPPKACCLTSSQDKDADDNILMMRGLDIPCCKLGTPTPSSSFSASTPTRDNMLADEIDESLKYHLHWEHQQQHTTANAVSNRQHKADNIVGLEEYPSSWECAQGNPKPWQGDYLVSGSSIGTEQSHEKNPWNHYFDSGM